MAPLRLAQAALLLGLLGPLGLVSGAPARSAPPDLRALHEHSRALEALTAAALPTTVLVRAQKAPGLSPGLDELHRALGLPRPTVAPRGESVGSGVIIDPSGLVITNLHVVGDPGAGPVEVTLFDGRRLAARVLGADPRADLCLLQLEGGAGARFPAARLGDSAAAPIGGVVLAIGHPFEFPFTVTVGVLSAKSRRGLHPDEIADYLQTDAPIHPGSSGGPLFDLRGEVIGINTAIYAPGAQAVGEGIGFAIPSRLVRDRLPALRAGGAPPRASLGLVPGPAPLTGGVAVARVLPRSRAAGAGLRPGDVVTEADGAGVADAAALAALVLTRSPRPPLVLGVQRGGARLRLTVPVEGAPPEPAPRDAVRWAGLSLAPATPEGAAARGLDLPEGAPAGALLVVDVEPGSAAAVAGALPGDLLVGLMGAPPADPLAWAERVGGRRVVSATVWRDGGALQLVISGG